MDRWQKLAVIVALLTFLRLVIKDILEYIEKKRKKKKKGKRKKR